MNRQELLNPRDWSSHPAQSHEPYKSARLRARRLPLVPLQQSLSELTAPVFGHEAVSDLDNDLTRNAAQTGEASGERIIVAGRVLDESGRPVQGVLLEVWQTNENGRYAHDWNQHAAALDPNFLGAARTVTDAEGRYRFTTIRPGAYPWANHHNAWRPAHIHFSVFGTAFIQRLVTQMYFPGDPLLTHDPIFNSTPDPAARQRQVAKFSLETTEPEWALGYRFDIVLRGPRATPLQT